MGVLFDEPIGKYCRRQVFYVEYGKSAGEAARVMKSSGVASVLVRKKGEPVGIVTLKDILFRVVSEGKDPEKVRVEEVMSSPLITINEKEPVKRALEMMDQHNVHRLLVVDDKGKVVGLAVETLISGDVFERQCKTRECEVEPKSWLSRYMMEVAEENIEQRMH
uniref:CBS domain-containing protein n=1 Tax=Candidatus Methanomethylicus mesodigestus TaxID=1867258 RepID=A0A7C3F566_9CREN